MSKLELIKSLSYEQIKKGRDENSVPYLKYLYQVHQALFNETCKSCPSKINSYISKVKNHKTETMSKEEKKSPKFSLKQGALVKLKSGKLVSTHNLSDELAVQILAENENRKVLFNKLPTNYASQVKKYKEKANQPQSETQTANQTTEKTADQKKTERKEELDHFHYTKLESIVEGYGAEYTQKDEAIKFILSKEFPSTDQQTQK